MIQAKLIAIAVAALVLFGAGWKTRDAFCDAAALRVEVAAAQAKQKTAEAQVAREKATTKDAQERAAKLEQEARELDERLEEFKRELAKRTKGGGSCRVSPGDLKRLQRL